MKKRVRRKPKNKNIKPKSKLGGIWGWLLVALLLCIYSAIYSTNLLIQRAWAIVSQTAAAGVYISAIILIFYCLFIWATVYLVIAKKKKAIKAYIGAVISGVIFNLWFMIIGQWIYYPAYIKEILIYNSPALLFNLALTFGILFYFLKSKRVKKTLIR